MFYESIFLNESRGVPGDRGAPLSFIPKGALTHHCPKGSGGIPPGGRAVRSSRSIHRMLRQRGAGNAAEPAGVGRHCLCGWQTAFASFASSLQSLSPFRDNLPPACENLPQHKARPSGAAALSQLWTMLPRTIHFLLYAPKETKTPPCGEQKGRDPLWRSITWKQRS